MEEWKNDGWNELTYLVNLTFPPGAIPAFEFGFEARVEVEVGLEVEVDIDGTCLRAGDFKGGFGLEVKEGEDGN